MIHLSSIAVASPSAAELAVLATIKEKLCRPFCIDSSVQPQATVDYILRPARFDESTVFVPVMATVTIVTPCGKCGAKTQIFSENFTVAFQGQSGLPEAVFLESKGKVMNGSDVKCGCAHSYTINDSLSIFIKPKE